MKIDITDNSRGDNLKSSEFPFDNIYTGKINETEDFKIFIKQETLSSIDDYLSSDINNELGGVLIGNNCMNSEGEKFITIDEMIIARHTNSSISRLTFTHDTWDYINDKLEMDFPGKIILGWFHSHPGHTVFLSNYDVFIQENFFNLEYMVAYVFDPTIRERGFFYKRNDNIVRSNGYYLYEIRNSSLDELKEIKEDSPKNLTDNSIQDLSDLAKNKSLATELKKYSIPLLFFINILLLLFILYNYFTFKEKMIVMEDLNREINEVKNQNLKLKEQLDNFIVENELNKVGLSGSVSEEKNKNNRTGNHDVSDVKMQNYDNSLKEKSKEISKESQKTGNTVESIKYTVKPGDTLEKIAILFYKNREGINYIMQKNELKNKADIKIGQVLEIPGQNE